MVRQFSQLCDYEHRCGRPVIQDEDEIGQETSTFTPKNRLQKKTICKIKKEVKLAIKINSIFTGSIDNSSSNRKRQQCV